MMTTRYRDAPPAGALPTREALAAARRLRDTLAFQCQTGHCSATVRISPRDDRFRPENRVGIYCSRCVEAL